VEVLESRNIRVDTSLYIIVTVAVPFDAFKRTNSSFAPGAKLANRTDNERSRTVLFNLSRMNDTDQ